MLGTLAGAAAGCSEDPDVKGTETQTEVYHGEAYYASCSEDPDVKGTETEYDYLPGLAEQVAARIPM